MLNEYDKQFWKKIYLLMGSNVKGWAYHHNELYENEYKKVIKKIDFLIREQYIIVDYHKGTAVITNKMIEEITN